MNTSVALSPCSSPRLCPVTATKQAHRKGHTPIPLHFSTQPNPSSRTHEMTQEVFHETPPSIPTALSSTDVAFTPKKRYPVVQSPSSKRLYVHLTPTAKRRCKERKPLLYSWKRIDPTTRLAQRLIGTTSQPDGRIAHYIWGFNHPEKVDGIFYKDVAAHPEEFSLGIVRDLQPNETSKEAETTAIMVTDALRTGYNQRLGGGGGQCQPTSANDSCPYTINEIVSMIHERYQSPQEKSVQVVNAVLSLELSDSEKKMKNVIYEFLFDPTGNKKHRIHHPGYTTTTLGQRMSSHFSCLNHPESRRCLSLYQEMRAHPEQVKMRIFNIEDLLNKGIPLPTLEKAFMQFFQQRGERVRNQNGGGKGSVAKGSYTG